jgi:DNA repair photolyase
MANASPSKLDYFVSEDVPEIKLHSNTEYCPLIYELIPAYGCQFECEYCNVYNLRSDSDFYPITVFRRYPELVEKSLEEHASKGLSPVYYFSPKTDVFQHALVDSGITQQILEVLVRRRAKYILVTKGRLPGPEMLELLAQSRDTGRVLISCGMKNQEHASILEPFAASIEERYQLAETCVKHGIPAMGVIEPILPFENLEFVEGIIARFAEIGIDHFAIDFARISQACLDKMIEKLPELEELRAIYKEPTAICQTFGTGPYRRESVLRYAPSYDYLREKYNLIGEYAQKHGSTISICNYFKIRGINTRAYQRGFLCFGIHDETRASQLLQLGTN